jgi:hypothetical protein
MIRHTSIFVATALAIVAFALTPSAAMAQSYSGSWPLTVTRSHHGNGTYCLTVTDNGTLGWPHSGEASLVGQDLGDTTLYGTFQLIDGLFMVTIVQPGDSGQNAGLVFIAHASGGHIGKGVYDQVYGGEEFDSGVLVFGVKNGC